MRKGSIKWLALFFFAFAVVAQGPPTKFPTDRMAWPSPSCQVAHQPYSPADNACVALASSSIGDSDLTSQTASQSTVTLVASTAGAGKYRISYYADQAATCATGSGAVYFSFQWTDARHSRTTNSVALTLASSQSANLGSIQGVVPIYAAASTAITYSSTVSGACSSGGPPSYDVHISVESVQ